MAMTLDRNEIVPPRLVATITVVVTARMLFQLTFVIRKVVARAANIPSKIMAMLWQASEMPIAVSPCLSLTPLRAII
jgi:hypothetical protein